MPSKMTTAKRSLLLALTEMGTNIVHAAQPGLWMVLLTKQTWTTATVRSLQRDGFLGDCSPPSRSALRVTDEGRAMAAKLAAEEAA